MPKSDSSQRKKGDSLTGADKTMARSSKSTDKPHRQKNKLDSGSAISIVTEQPHRYVPYDEDPAKAEIGRGGMGRVLIVFDRNLERWVAIKEHMPLNVSLGGTYKEQQPDSPIDSLKSRFIREARITGQLSHPNIVPVYELGTRENGTLYYTMKMVKGRTLFDAMQECPTLEERLKLLPRIVDLCNAIAYAHNQGVIHRDIKPQNVMLGEFGETVVLDWGIAKKKGTPDLPKDELQKKMALPQLTGDQTIDGSAIGTPEYMSPEQAEGKLDEIDEQSDVWSLGGVLYHLLVGHPPFQGKNQFEVIGKVINQVVIPPQKLIQQVPAELNAICEKALQKKKQNRYTNAKELALEMETYMAGGRVRAYEYSSWELFKKFAVNHKGTIGGSILIILIILVALILVFISYKQERVAKQQAEDTSTHLKMALKEETKSKQEEHRQNVLSNFHLAQSLNEKANSLILQRRYLETRIYAAGSMMYNPSHKALGHHPELSDLQGKADRIYIEAASKWYQSQYRMTRRLLFSHKDKGDFRKVNFSSDGRYLATAGPDHIVTVWDMKARKVFKMLEGHKDWVWDVVFLKNGKRLLSAGMDRTVILWDLSTGRPISFFRDHARGVVSIKVTPDDKKLISASADQNIKIWDIEKGLLLKTIQAHSESIMALTLSPDGNILASGAWDNLIKLWDIRTGRLVRTLKGHTMAVSGLDFSRDGTELVSGSLDKTLRLWNLKTAQEPRIFEESDHPVLAVKFSPTSDLIASTDLAGNIRFSDKTIGILVEKISVHRNSVYGLAFSPDGQNLVTGGSDQTLNIWQIQTNQPFKRFYGSKTFILGLAISPDGKLLATGGFDKIVRVWDIKNEALLATFTGHKSSVDYVAFSPDCKKIVSGGVDNSIFVWNIRKQDLLLHLTAHTEPVNQVLFSPDGKWIISASEDSSILIWDSITGAIVRKLSGHKSDVIGISVSSNGRYLASVGIDKNLIIWDLESFRIKYKIPLDDWATIVEFFQDNKRLVTGEKNGGIRIWDAMEGKQLHFFKGHTQSVNAVKVSRDNRLIASAGSDFTTIIWSTEQLKPLLILTNFDNVFSLDFTPDSKSLALGYFGRVLLSPLDLSLLQFRPENIFQEAQKEAGIKLDVFEIFR